MKLTRRNFLNRGVAAAVVGLGGPFSFVPFDLPFRPRFDYGPLKPAASQNTGETLLAIPEDFRYVVFGRAGDRMSDGHATPARPDGMAAFADGSFIRLVRNHEIFDLQQWPLGPLSASWDAHGGGGTTTLVIDPVTRLPVRDFVSLTGTSGNCSGGPTPWGTWISCEETVDGPGAGFEKNHGYCFEVSSSLDGPVHTAPIKEMGRFLHEAAAVDPETGFVYLTEDVNPAGFYRFIPTIPGDLEAGGRLQMLAVDGMPGFDAREPIPSGPLVVRWVDIDDPDPLNAETVPDAVYQQGANLGGATFSRLEGMVFFEGSVYFTATDEGPAGLGRIWKLFIRPPRLRRGRPVRPPVYGSSIVFDRSGESSEQGGTGLILVREAHDVDEFSGPDNLTVSPRGDIVICEDGKSDRNSIRGLTRSGKPFEIARNIIEDPENGEFSGATFDASGTLFVNIQEPGLTLAIWGPW